MKKYIVLILTVVLIIILGLSFIEYDNISATNSILQQEITYGADDISQDFSEVSNLSSTDINILCALTKGLVEKNSDGEIIPSLASEFIKSEDGIQYEFKIRDDVFWSNGDKVTAKDVVTFFKELLKESCEDDIHCIMNIYGARAFKEGKVSFDNGVAVNCNDNNVVIRLNNRYDNFLEDLSKPQYRLRRNLVMWNNLIKNHSNLDYCGDYKIKEAYETNILLEENNNYDKFKYINFIRDDSVEIAMAAYEINERDIVKDPPESELNKLKNENNLITIPENKATYMVINNSSISMYERREIYKLVYKAVEEYYSKNTQEFELAEGCYFREEKNNLTRVQQRKVDSSKEYDWSKPQVLTFIARESKQNKILLRIIKEWFKNNTDITVKFTLANEDEFNDSELKNRYDVVIVNNEPFISDKEKFYLEFKEYISDTDNDSFNKSEINNGNGDYCNLEDGLFYNYKILPLIFYNENMAVSDKISEIVLDGNNNIIFNKLN